jgi:Integrase
MALTDLKVRNVKPNGKVIKISDGEGLYLQVQPNGTKLWRLAYRFLGKQKTLAIGTYPEISLQEARERKMEARKLLAQGIDPSEHKKDQIRAAKLASGQTFKAVAKEFLAKCEAKGYAKDTLDKKKWILNDLVIPVLGHRPIADIRPSEILELLSDIEASGRLETAKRVRQTIGAVFRLAALTDRAPGDPTPVLRGQIRAPRVTSYPAIVRPDEFGELMRRISTIRSTIVRLALEFQAHTFTRPIEIRFATWDEIDLETSVWTIPAERMKKRRPHDVPLVPATRQILREVRKYTGRSHGLIFHSPQNPNKPLSENTLNKNIWALGYKGRHCSHGFRSSASTILNESKKYDKDVIEFQLAHLVGSETRRAYNRAQWWDQRVQMMHDWADMIAEMRERSVCNHTSCERIVGRAGRSSLVATH